MPDTMHRFNVLIDLFILRQEYVSKFVSSDSMLNFFNVLQCFKSAFNEFTSIVAFVKSKYSNFTLLN